MRKHSNTVDPDIIKKAIDEAGGVDAVAKCFGLSDRAVRKWWQVGRVPDEHVPELCRMGGFSVRPKDLNPKLYPPYITE